MDEIVVFLRRRDADEDAEMDFEVRLARIGDEGKCLRPAATREAAEQVAESWSRVLGVRNLGEYPLGEHPTENKSENAEEERL